MSESHPPSQSDAKITAAVAVRPLARRYLAVLVAVAGLVLLDQAILQPLLLQLNFSAPAINLAGRQRMLSQKISKEALALELSSAGADREARAGTLHESLDQWTAAHQALVAGDAARGVRPASGPIAEALREVEPAQEDIRAAASQLIATPQASNPEAAGTILAREPEFLAGMEHVVSLLEQSARARVALLRVCGAIAMLSIIVLLACVYFIVLRPAAEVIHRQVELLREARDDLERRVQARTRELSAANEALEREMTEREAAELRMRALSAELAHASRVNSLGQLATGLAHEINQPLATVANYAGTLELLLEQSTPPPTESLSLVAQIKQAALRAGTIVRRMRNFVRRGEVQAAHVDLNLLVGEVLELCRPELVSGEVRLTVELASAPALVSADAVQIQQVLVNLVQNAIQAMHAVPPSSRTLFVRLALDPRDITIEVADSGSGLPAAILASGFAPFQSSKQDGLGLGLAISHTIIEQHQGRIWCTNREQGGAVVSFSLPRLDQHDLAAEQHSHCVCG